LKAVEIASTFAYRGEYLWDRLLGSRRIMYGVATDDAHGVPDSNKAWTVVYAPALTKQSIIDSLNSGNSYAVRCGSGACVDFRSLGAIGNTLSASTSAPANYMWIGYRDGYATESGRNMVLDAAHTVNRRVAIPGRTFTAADVGRLLYVSSTEPGHWVRTGAYHITGVVGASAVLDRIISSTNGETSVWWELGGGWVLRSHTGTSDSYSITGAPERGDHLYVRLFCVVDHDRQLWSQPFFIR
jgi:hypothetical protein